MVNEPVLDTLAPSVVVHLVSAVAALVLGPLVLSARKGSRLHRASGCAWVTLMLAAAASSLFIRDFALPNVAGYTPIDLLTSATFAGLGAASWAIARRRVRRHRQAMWATYLGGCVVAGSLALLPGRYLGDLLWRHTLGVA